MTTNCRALRALNDTAAEHGLTYNDTIQRLYDTCRCGEAECEPRPWKVVKTSGGYGVIKNIDGSDTVKTTVIRPTPEPPEAA